MQLPIMKELSVAGLSRQVVRAGKQPVGSTWIPQACFAQADTVNVADAGDSGSENDSDKKAVARRMQAGSKADASRQQSGCKPAARRQHSRQQGGCKAGSKADASRQQSHMG
jgi:hypothetical protein